MEISNNKVNAEEREEGEIVEDELEDVSDCSISSPLYLGKSVSPTEHLRAVSLSSISDNDLDNNHLNYNRRRYVRFIKTNCARYAPLPLRKRPNKHHKPKNKCTRKRQQKRSNATSDSEEEKLDRRTLRQLKEAVRINTSKEVHQNSLRTRLRGLIEPITSKTQSEDETELIKLRTDALQSKNQDNCNTCDENDCISEKNKTSVECSEEKNPDPEGVDDKELTELRLEALKSAMLKKHLERKKRKATEEQTGLFVKSDINEVNKENNHANSNKDVAGIEGNSCKKLCTEKSVSENINISNISIEEDLDIMRAMLLASMSKKIAEVPNVLHDTIVKPTYPTLPKPIVRTIINAPNSPGQKPRLIKRTVRNTYFNNRIVNNTKSKMFKPIVPNVEPLIINVNNDSDSDMDLDNSGENDSITKTVTAFLKQQRAEVEAKKNEEKPDILLDKSVVKLLPVSQQVEYHKLKQQLLNAKRKPRVRRSSDMKKDTVATKRTIRSKFSLIKTNSSFKERMKPVRNNQVDKNKTTSLQKTLIDLQIQKDGRLQVKGKYQELAPLLEKVNQVSVERKRYENDIKRLLQELDKTKQKFNTSHQNFKSLIEELMRKKEYIDTGATAMVLPNNEKQQNLATSTPLKATDIKTTVDHFNKLQDSIILPNQTVSPAPQQGTNTIITMKTIKEDVIQVQTNHESQNLQNSLPILDPNDINEDFMKQHCINRISCSRIPEYVSPLDNRECATSSDPLVMYCPFDLLGVCKDKECAYKHCS